MKRRLGNRRFPVYIIAALVVVGVLIERMPWDLIVTALFFMVFCEGARERKVVK